MECDLENNGGIEFADITNMPIAPLISVPFALHWSEDDHLSILTEKGVHILELTPTPMSAQPTLNFNRSFIYPPDICPGEIFAEKAGKKLWRLERDQIYPLLMQESLTPKLDGVTAIDPKIKKVSWSPRNIVYPNKCLVAILTSTGSCLLLKEMGAEWYIVFNLCEKASVNMAEGIETPGTCELRKDLAPEKSNAALPGSKYNAKLSVNNTNSENVNKSQELGETAGSSSTEMSIADAMSLANKFIVTTMAWSANWDPCYIIVSYKSKTCIIYRIPRVYDIGTAMLKVAGKIQMEEIVNQMCWITISTRSSLVIVSDLKGNISGYVLEEAQDSITVKRKEVYYEYGDKILVTGICVISENDKTIIIATKGTYLLVLTFDQKKEFIGLKHLQVDGFFISGIAKVMDGEALLTTDNGLLYHFRVDDFSCLKVKTDHSSLLPKQRFLGVTISPSTAFIVYVASPATVYDHLVNREPSKLIFLALKTVNPMTILISNRDQSLDGVWDSLELVRITAIRTSKLPEIPKDLACLSIYELKIFLWISVMNEVFLKKTLIKHLAVADDFFEPQQFIFLRSACDFTKKLLQKKTLSKEERRAIYNLEMYLEVFLAGEEDGKESKRTKQMLKAIQRRITDRESKFETCTLCESVIDDVPWKAVRCPQGHALPRCGLTLLQVPTVNQKVCKICQQIFHPLVGETTCLYCDVPLITDVRVTGLPPGIGKSLSRKVLSNNPTETAEKET